MKNIKKYKIYLSKRNIHIIVILHSGLTKVVTFFIYNKYLL